MKHHHRFKGGGPGSEGYEFNHFGRCGKFRRMCRTIFLLSVVLFGLALGGVVMWAVIDGVGWVFSWVFS